MPKGKKGKPPEDPKTTGQPLTPGDQASPEQAPDPDQALTTRLGINTGEALVTIDPVTSLDKDPEGQLTDMVETKQNALTKLLPCQLSDKEMLAKGQDIAQLVGRLVALKEEKKQVAAEYSAREKALVNDLGQVQQALSTGKEVRTVACHLVFDYAQNKVKTVRADTGEEINVRTMEIHERQKALKFEEPKGKEGKEANEGPAEQPEPGPAPEPAAESAPEPGKPPF